MINILSYVGMNLQSEVCLWTLLGLIRTIFDATLFKVNANLKQVWQMNMPEELSMPVQRALRTIISGVMLVQCFTVYVYIAAYIVLLYPVFLEERPTLVLPWLLLAAVRKLLCELTSLALGLGTCVLLGPARTPCIKFVVIKITAIFPAFYMWLLVLSYYHTLKIASTFKSFPVTLVPSNHDYGLELAVRRRRTKSLMGEDQLRKRMISNFSYIDAQPGETSQSLPKLKMTQLVSVNIDVEDTMNDLNFIRPLPTISNRVMSETVSCEDWFGTEVVVPRDTDRILEQFCLMLLQISAYLKKEGIDSVKFTSSHTRETAPKLSIECTALSTEDTETPPLVGNTTGRTASYLRDYPNIFNKKPSDLPFTIKSDHKINGTRTIERDEFRQEDNGRTLTTLKRTVSIAPNERVSVEIKKVISRKKEASPKISSRAKELQLKSSKRQTFTRPDRKSKDIVWRKSSNNNLPVKNITKQKRSCGIQTSSTDSLRSIIDSMRNRLSSNKKPSLEGETKRLTDYTSSCNGHIDNPSTSSDTDSDRCKNCDTQGQNKSTNTRENTKKKNKDANL